MAIDHYENFPVASFLLPAALRRPVALIYRFARAADDIADEGDAPPAVRLQQLEDFRRQLGAIEAGLSPTIPWFADLADMIHEFRLPLEPFRHLLSAFSQDVSRKRYRDFDDLLDYCRRSADPVGRLLLHLYGAATPENQRYSDAICTALQLINFLQDVALDMNKGRVYLPEDEMARYGVTVEQISAGQTGEHWRQLMTFQVSRARSMLLAGAPLGRLLRGRPGLETRMIVCGGARVLAKIMDVQGDMFRQRPVLRWYDWPVMLLQAL